MTYLAPHFTLDELTVTQQRGPDGKIIPNVPTGDALAYLTKLAGVLEQIRSLWGCPVKVNSAYRCEAVEIKVSGKAYGQHMLGQAADIVPLSNVMSVKKAYEIIWRSSLPYDQLLLEMVHEVAWIHISISPSTRVARRQALFTPDTKTWLAYNPNLVKESGNGGVVV